MMSFAAAVVKLAKILFVDNLTVARRWVILGATRGKPLGREPESVRALVGFLAQSIPSGMTIEYDGRLAIKDERRTMAREPGDWFIQ